MIMSEIAMDVDCPKCGYKGAMLQADNHTGDQCLCCDRCGYSMTSFIDSKKREATGEIVRKVTEDGGGGYYAYQKKGERGNWMNPTDEREIEYLKEHLDELSVFEHHFEKDGKWFLEDIIKNETKSYPEPDYDTLW